MERDHIAEDVRTYRQHVRAKLPLAYHKFFNTPAEHPYMHDWFTKRGLRVQKSNYTYYDDKSHTLYHHDPENKSAVVASYLGFMREPVKLARPEHPDARAFEAAMEANPDDRTAKLVYADWLDEQGNKSAAARLRWWAGAHAHIESPTPLKVGESEELTRSLPQWARRLAVMQRIRQHVASVNNRFKWKAPMLAALASTERDAIGVESEEDFQKHIDSLNAFLRTPGGSYSLAMANAANADPQAPQRLLYATMHVHRARHPGMNTHYTTNGGDANEAQNWIRDFPINPNEPESRVTEYGRRGDDPNKLSRFVIKPGEPLFGGEDFMHEVHDEAGKRLGHIWVQPKEGGTVLHINHVGMLGHEQNATGVSGVRDVIRGLKAHYPTAARITGLRVSGRRRGNAVDAKLARRDKDPYARKSELKAFIAATHPIYPRITRRLPHFPRVEETSTARNATKDDTAHGAFADWLREVTGNPEDPRATVVQHHDPRLYPFTGPLVPEGWTTVGHHTTPVYATKHNTPVGLTLRAIAPVGSTDTPSGAVEWTVPTTSNLPARSNIYGHGRRLTYGTILHGIALHQLIDQLPEPHRTEWRDYAWAHNMPDQRQPEKLARNEMKVVGAGDANRQIGSANHNTRLALVKTILAEAGLTKARVQAVFSHEGATGARPAVAATLAQADPRVARFAAAWIGLLTGQKNTTVFHPGEGEDMLHLIDSPHPPEHVGEYLRRAGVPTFSLEKRAGGTRAYVVNPMDLIDVQTAARGLQGTTQSIPGTAIRLGAGSQKDARAAYRTVIEDAEKEASNG